MMVGGVALLLILPRDPWPAGMFVYLAACSTAGSHLGQLWMRSSCIAAFFVSWALTSLILTSTGLLVDITRGRSMLSYYRQWWLMVAFFVCLYSLAGTLFAFPAIEWMRKLIQKRARRESQAPRHNSRE